ncbi:MAG: hypothetical protein ACT4PU_02665 [Planctomycetota bacterium]
MLSLLITALLCSPLQTAPAGPAAQADRVIARAEGIELRASDYGAWLIERRGVDLAQDFILEAIAIHEARQRGLLPTDEQVAEACAAEHEQIVNRIYLGELDKYKDKLKWSGYELEEWQARRRQELPAEMALEALARADRPVSEDAIRARFKSLYGARSELASVEVLFFNTYRDVTLFTGKPDLPALRLAARQRAEAARAAFLAGRTVAQLLPESDSTGKLPIVAGRIEHYQANMLGVEVEQAVQGLDAPGEVALVDVFDGTWAVRLVSRRTVSYDELRDTLAADIAQGAVTSEEALNLRTRLLTQYRAEVLLP